MTTFDEWRQTIMHRPGKEVYIIDAGYFKEGGNGSDKQLRQSALNHKEVGFDYTIHATPASNNTTIASWSNKLNPSKLIFWSKEDQLRAQVLYDDHQRKWKSFRARQDIKQKVKLQQKRNQDKLNIIGSPEELQSRKGWTLTSWRQAVSTMHLGSAPLYVVETGLKDEKAFNHFASHRSLSCFDYEIHSILNEEGKYVIRTWSKHLHPSKLDFALREDMDRATGLFEEHNKLWGKFNMRQGVAKEKNNAAGKRRYDAFNEDQKIKKYKRDDSNKAKRIETLREAGKKKCEGTGCRVVLPLEDFVYSPAEAGVADYCNGGIAAQQKKERPVCVNCFPYYVELSREYQDRRPDQSEYIKEYESREEVKERRKKWRQANPELMKKYCRKYIETHREERNEANKNRLREYRKTDKYREYMLNWRVQLNRRLKEYKKMHHASGRSDHYSLDMWKLEDEDALDLLAAPECFYCGAPNGAPDENGQGELKMTIDRVEPLGNYELGNVYPCCLQCNKAKRIQSLEQFIQMCTNVYNYTEFGIPAEKPVDWWHTHTQKEFQKPCNASTYNTYKYDANAKHRVFDINQHEFTRITSGTCHYCGIAQRIGIDRLDSRVGYTVENCVPACTACNMSKNLFSEEDFYRMTSAVAANNELTCTSD